MCEESGQVFYCERGHDFGGQTGLKGPLPECLRVIEPAFTSLISGIHINDRILRLRHVQSGWILIGCCLPPLRVCGSCRGWQTWRTAAEERSSSFFRRRFEDIWLRWNHMTCSGMHLQAHRDAAGADLGSEVPVPLPEVTHPEMHEENRVLRTFASMMVCFHGDAANRRCRQGGQPSANRHSQHMLLSLGVSMLASLKLTVKGFLCKKKKAAKEWIN